jgi:two-component system NtrC family sensor kinase
MNARGTQEAVRPQRLLWPFAGMLLLSIALQAASLVAVQQIDTSVNRSRQHVAVASNLRTVVEQFENATYLAVVGLATSDWELLLRQRTTVQELARRFSDMNTALLKGGSTQLDGMEITLVGTEDPELLLLLTTAQKLWDKAYAAHVRVLRSENRSLKQNPDLEEFRTLSRELSGTVGNVSALLQRQAYERMGQLGRVQRLIPVGAFLLTLGVFAFVLGRILLPYALSMEELARSEGQLRLARDELEERVASRTRELAGANEALLQAHEGLERRVRERTQELKDTQRRAVELARQAGMAELATNVLHNVGNVLNSLNTSSTILSERLKALRVEPLVKVAGMFEEHQAELATFLTVDERGQRLPLFLGKLGQHLSTERTEMMEMTAGLQRYVEHIRVIVELQQTYAHSSSLIEATSLEELVEDALRINGAALGRHGVTIERHITPMPRVMVDKHKLLQILLNLVSNAKYALDAKPAEERRLAVTVDRPTGDRVRLQVRDNGMGIERELLTKIFQHGFTTRKEGHGFGLHSCAIAAQALGGSLTAHSDGPGTGATFTLDLPYQLEASAKGSQTRT